MGSYVRGRWAEETLTEAERQRLKEALTEARKALRKAS